MAQNSSIEWTEATWNPVTGCTKISPGCAHCYAERMAKRLQAMGQPRYRNAFEVTLQGDVLQVPLHWRRPRMIFVNSMGDLFHKDVPTEFIAQCFAVMEQASQHTFQVLTKRPERAARLAGKLPWPENVWMGTSVEKAEYTLRIDAVIRIPAAIRFLSPNHSWGQYRDCRCAGVDWVIVGGESGPGARPMEARWVLQIRSRCLKYGVPFFFKQWGGIHKSKAGRELDGRIWNEMPTWGGRSDGEREKSVA